MTYILETPQAQTTAVPTGPILPVCGRHLSWRRHVPHGIPSGTDCGECLPHWVGVTPELQRGTSPRRQCNWQPSVLCNFHNFHLHPGLSHYIRRQGSNSHRHFQPTCSRPRRWRLIELLHMPRAFARCSTVPFPIQRRLQCRSTEAGIGAQVAKGRRASSSASIPAATRFTPGLNTCSVTN